MVSAGRLTVVGLGPGALDQITPEAAAALHAADDVVGYLPYVSRAQALLAQAGQGQAVAWHASDNRVELERARQALALAAQGRQVVVVSSGDPGVFAMASAVFEAMESADAVQAAAWQALDIQVLPGITAMLAAAARAGAPLGHDFCCINLSDNLKPWPVIARRVELAAEADFAMAFYNPRSKSRPEGFVRLLQPQVGLFIGQLLGRAAGARGLQVGGQVVGQLGPAAVVTLETAQLLGGVGAVMIDA